MDCKEKFQYLDKILSIYPEHQTINRVFKESAVSNTLFKTSKSGPIK